MRPSHNYLQERLTNLLKKIESHRKGKSRSLLGDLYPLVNQIENYLIEQGKITKIIVVGSFRRMKETVGDIDILVVSKDSAKVIDDFTSMPHIKEVLSQGTSKAFVRLSNGTDVDLLVYFKFLIKSFTESVLSTSSLSAQPLLACAIPNLKNV